MLCHELDLVALVDIGAFSILSLAYPYVLLEAFHV
jgi:hypothetical protein